MPVYEASALTTVTTASANAPLCAFRQIDNVIAEVMEVQLFSLTAPTTSGGIGLARSTALGTGTLTTVLGVPRDPSSAATTSGIVTNWATAAPSIGTVFRRVALPASLGNGVIWTWDLTNLFLIAANAAATSELVFVNLPGTAPGTYYVNVIWKS